MYASIYTVYVVLALFQGNGCSSAATVHWYKCGDKYYYIGVKRSSWDESLKLCAQLFQGTHVADFGSKPVNFAKRCHFSLAEKRQYWIECWYGQPQSDCTKLTKEGQTFKTSLSSCSNLAYPICETSNVPIKTTTAPTTRKTTSVLTTRKRATRKLTSVLTTSTPTLAPTTSKITSVPTRRRTPSVPTTPVSTVVSTTRLPFSILCALIQGTNPMIQGWLNIAQHSYCVTRATYSYSDARKACRSVNGTLADIHSMLLIINPIVVGLGLSHRTNLKIWINGTRQGNERLLQINGQLGQLPFTSDNISSKHQVMCERLTSKQNTSIVNPLLSPTSSISAKTPTSSAIPKLSTPSAMLMTSQNSSLSLSQRGTQSTISAMPMSFANASLSTSQRGSFPSSSFMSITSTTSAMSVLSTNASLPTSRMVFTSARSDTTSLAPNPIALYSRPSGSSVPDTTIAFTTGGKRNNTWVRIGAYEYYVNYDLNNYTSAEEYCKRTAHALLMAFFSPIRYFQVLSQLNVSNGSYWIGANNNGINKLADKCLSYHRHTNTLSTSNCTTEMFSVCSIYRNNVTEILENVAFMQMLKDMSVNKADTSVNKRKLFSVNNDHRWSVKAAGSISVLVICLTVMFPLLIDLNKLACCRKTIFCKTKENGKSGE